MLQGEPDALRPSAPLTVCLRDGHAIWGVMFLRLLDTARVAEDRGSESGLHAHAKTSSRPSIDIIVGVVADML